MPNEDFKDRVKNLFPGDIDTTEYDDALEKIESVAQGIQEVLGDPFVVRLGDEHPECKDADALEQ